MITFVVRMRVKPEYATAFEALMNEACEKTRANEPGVVYYAWSKGVDEPDTYVVIEVYRDAASQAAHMATDWVRNSLPHSEALIEGKPESMQYATPGTEPATKRIY